MNRKIINAFQKLESLSISRMVSPDAIKNADIAYWRARILFLLLFSGLLISLFVFIPVSILAIKGKIWGLLIFDILVWISGIWLLLSRRLGYQLRAGIVLLLLYGVGLMVIISVGPLSGGPAWLFTFAILVAIFLGTGAAIVALTINALTLATTVWLIKTGVFGHSFPFFSSDANMYAAGASFMMLNALAAISIAVLVRGLVSTHQKEIRLTRALEEKNDELLLSKAKIESEIEERKQTEERLKTSEKRYRFLADNVTDNIWTTDMEMNFTYISPSIKRIRGYSVEEALTHKLEEIMPPSSYEIAVQIMAEELEMHIRGEKPPERPRKIEIELYRKDGSRVWCEVEANFIYDSTGNPNGMIGVTRDITERKQTAEQLLRSEKMATLGDMVAGVAHEISTPLGVGLISASFLSDRAREFEKLCHSGTPSTREIEKYAQKIVDASSMVLPNLERAAELLNSFKNVAVDQVIEEKRRFNVRSNMEDTVNSLRPRYKRTEHVITIECDDHLEINSYPGAFSQITTNLIINSLIHGFEDIPKGTILINIKQKQNTLQYTYQDTGKGMDEKTMSRLFDPFFTTKRNRGGIGLGMHVVHNLITQTLKGRIEVGSSVGIGTRFLITIPMTAR
ncbi:MAG: PAS domain S-box protein [Desulfobacteraceae bacterium]|nr:MAG: PAS domain S-box protein [Desulfobacteraceae bacterium]